MHRQAEAALLPKPSTLLLLNIMHSNELIDSADHEHLLMWLGSTACERQSLRSLDQLK